MRRQQAFEANERARLQLMASAANSSRYHRAAIEGYVDLLCEASKRDTNAASADQAGLTPTLLAAFGGRLEALRILVGRGGKPERTAADGSSALHLAAAANRLNCVSFLVNFGANMWALDNELRTPKEVAALGKSKEALEFLEQQMAKQSALNTKRVQKLKEEAKLAAEKRLKQLRKAQMKALKQFERDERYLVKLSNNRRLIKAAHSISDIQLVGRCEPINYSPADLRWPTSRMVGCNSGDGSGHALGPRSPAAPTLTSNLNTPTSNYLGNLLKGAGRRRRASQIVGGDKGAPITTGGRATYTRRKGDLSDGSSAYSSSVSSTSGYLSSCSASALSSASTSLASGGGGSSGQRRPKYSDLVALDQRETARPAARAAPKWAQSKRWPAFGEDQAGATRLASCVPAGNHSGATIRDNLEAPSTALGSRERAASEQPKCRVLSPPPPPLPVGAADEKESPPPKEAADVAATGDRLKSTQLTSVRASNIGDCSGSSSSIEWPPAPTMSRATSEPDFVGATLQAEAELAAVEAPTATAKATAAAAAAAVDCAGEESSPTGNASAKLACEPSELGGVQGSDVKRPAESAGLLASGSECDQSQHELLTKCLSQLKMRHEAFTRRQQRRPLDETSDDEDDNEEQLLKPSRIKSSGGRLGVATCGKLVPAGLASSAGGRLQVNPQQQQRRQQANLEQQRSARFVQLARDHDRDDDDDDDDGDDQQDNLAVSSPTTITSADSIGSAGSLAQRSLRSSKSSASVSCSLSSAPSSCSMGVSRLANNAVRAPLAVANGFTQSENITKHGQAEIGNCCRAVETIELFLTSNGLLELSQVFARERIDLEALMLLTEEDLKSLQILLGPRRKLIKAIGERRRKSATNEQESSKETCTHNNENNNNNYQANKSDECDNSNFNDSVYLVLDTPL